MPRVSNDRQPSHGTDQPEPLPGVWAPQVPILTVTGGDGSRPDEQGLHYTRKEWSAGIQEGSIKRVMICIKEEPAERTSASEPTAGEDPGSMGEGPFYTRPTRPWTPRRRQDLRIRATAWSTCETQWMTQWETPQIQGPPRVDQTPEAPGPWEISPQARHEKGLL